MQKRNFTLARFLLVGCVFIIVAVPFHALFTAWLASSFGHFDLLRIWKEILLLVLMIIAAALLIQDKKLLQEMAGSKLAWLIGLFFMITLLTTVGGLITNRVGLNAAVYGLIIDTRSFAFMLVVLVAARKAGSAANWPRWVIIPAGIVILFGLLQLTVLPQDFLRHFGYGPATLPPFQNVDNRPGLMRLQSTLRGPNPLGAYLAAVLILAIAYSRRFIPKYHYVIYASLLLSLIVLFKTYSRSAYLGFIAAGLVYIFLSIKNTRTKRIFSVLVIGVAVLGGAGVLALRNNDAVQNVVFHSSEHSTSPTSSNFLRTAALRQGAADIMHNPFGKGVGSAGPSSFRNQKAPARISENFFLQIGQESGIIGLGLFISILVIIFRRLWLRRDEDIYRALLASFICLIVINMVSHAWADDTLAYVFFGAVGFAIAGAKTVQKAKKRATL